MVSPQILNQKQKKKYRESEIEPITSLEESHHIASSLASRSNPNTKANQTQRTPANQTQRFSSKPNTKHRGVYKKKKKKKIPNTQTKTKPSNPRMVTSLSSSPQLARRHRRRSPGHPLSQIVDQRLENADRSASASVLGAPSGPPSTYFALFLSDSLSVSLSLSHWN